MDFADLFALEAFGLDVLCVINLLSLFDLLLLLNRELCEEPTG